MGCLMSLVDYAQKHQKDPRNVRRMAVAGRFNTAQKIGRNWLIDSAEAFPMDDRIKSGKYVKNRST